MDLTFYYRARTPEGSAVAGSMAAESLDGVLAHLRTRALFVTSVTAGNSLPGRVEQLRGIAGLKRSSVVLFFRTFATMLSAGVAMQRVLGVQIAQCTDRRMREALYAIRSEIESGRSLSAALRTRPREFPALYVAMVEAGESGGMLDVVLERLATLLERQQALQRRVAASLAYPAVVLTAAILLIFFLAATIVPTFGRLYSQLDVPLPMTTKMLITIGNAAANPHAWLAGAAILAAGLGLAALAARKGRLLEAADLVRFRIPVLAGIQRRAITARVMRVLGALLHSGVDVLRAVDIVAPLTGSAVYARALNDLSASLREGESIAAPLERSGVFDAFTVALVRVGEESGSLDSMMTKIAQQYESEVEAAMLALTSTIEPVLICLVGVVVAGIVFSVFIPLYSLVGQIH